MLEGQGLSIVSDRHLAFFCREVEQYQTKSLSQSLKNSVISVQVKCQVRRHNTSSKSLLKPSQLEDCWPSVAYTV